MLERCPYHSWTLAKVRRSVSKQLILNSVQPVIAAATLLFNILQRTLSP
jgi:hypothetical protein